MTVSTSLVVLWFGRQVGKITRPSREMNMSIHLRTRVAVSGMLCSFGRRHAVASLDNTVVGVEALS